jgi:hypothetical protein
MKKTFVCIAVLLIAAAGSVFAQTFSIFTYDDQKSQNGTSTITKTEAEETIGGKKVTTYAFEGKVTTKYQYGFVGVILEPDAATQKLLAAGKGVRFKVQGDGKRYRFAVETPGGADNHYGKEFATIKNKESTVTIEYSTLKQELYWGEPKTFKSAEIIQLKIQTVGQPIPSFNFKIYDIEIIK